MSWMCSLHIVWPEAQGLTHILYSQQKQDLELTVAQSMKSLLQIQT